MFWRATGFVLSSRWNSSSSESDLKRLELRGTKCKSLLSSGGGRDARSRRRRRASGVRRHAPREAPASLSHTECARLMSSSFQLEEVRSGGHTVRRARSALARDRVPYATTALALSSPTSPQATTTTTTAVPTRAARSQRATTKARRPSSSELSTKRHLHRDCPSPSRRNLNYQCCFPRPGFTVVSNRYLTNKAMLVLVDELYLL